MITTPARCCGPSKMPCLCWANSLRVRVVILLAFAGVREVIGSLLRFLSARSVHLFSLDTLLRAPHILLRPVMPQQRAQSAAARRPQHTYNDEDELPPVNIRPLTESALARLYTRPVSAMQDKRKADKAEEDRVERRVSAVSPKALKYHNEQADKALYYDAIARKKRNLEKLERKIYPETGFEQFCRERKLKTKLEPDELDDLGKRLCVQSLDSKRRTLAHAERKVYGDPAATTKKLPKTVLKAAGDRLCNGFQAHRKATMKALEDKYLWKPKGNTKRIHPSEFNTIFSRLASKDK